MDGMERFACPTPDRQGRYRCIDDHVLCDGFVDCPEGRLGHRPLIVGAIFLLKIWIFERFLSARRDKCQRVKKKNQREIF